MPKGVEKCSAGATPFEHLDAFKPGVTARSSIVFWESQDSDATIHTPFLQARIWGAPASWRARQPRQADPRAPHKRRVAVHADRRNFEEGDKGSLPTSESTRKMQKGLWLVGPRAPCRALQGIQEGMPQCNSSRGGTVWKNDLVHGSVVPLIHIHFARRQHYESLGSVHVAQSRCDVSLLWYRQVANLCCLCATEPLRCVLGAAMSRG